MSSCRPNVIVLIGATASGKTELAIEIAEYFKTRIHNIDSRQIYKFMDIGTAKPSENQQKKIKHFLIDIEEPINHINVKQFQEIAQKSIKGELKKNKLSLKLTERETDMILFLNNSKKPVNIETLEKEIWQHSSELETHTVETHIYRLRKKIKAEFGNDDLIKSNKNGYTI